MENASKAKPDSESSATNDESDSEEEPNKASIQWLKGIVLYDIYS